MRPLVEKPQMKKVPNSTQKVALPETSASVRMGWSSSAPRLAAWGGAGVMSVSP